MAKIDYRQYKSLPDLIKEIKEKGLATSSMDARKVIHRMIPKESYFQMKIIKYLKTIDGAFVWKEHSGGFQRGGMPDVGCIIKGQYFGFEIKRPFIGKVSDIQRETIEAITAAGGHAHVVSYVTEVAKIIKEAGVIKDG